jgi:CRP-like cAMP-binding protein
VARWWRRKAAAKAEERRRRAAIAAREGASTAAADSPPPAGARGSERHERPAGGATSFAGDERAACGPRPSLQLHAVATSGEAPRHAVLHSPGLAAGKTLPPPAASPQRGAPALAQLVSGVLTERRRAIVIPATPSHAGPASLMGAQSHGVEEGSDASHVPSAGMPRPPSSRRVAINVASPAAQRIIARLHSVRSMRSAAAAAAAAGGSPSGTGSNLLSPASVGFAVDLATPSAPTAQAVGAAAPQPPPTTRFPFSPVRRLGSAAAGGFAFSHTTVMSPGDTTAAPLATLSAAQPKPRASAASSTAPAEAGDVPDAAAANAEPDPVLGVRLRSLQVGDSFGEGALAAAWHEEVVHSVSCRQQARDSPAAAAASGAGATPVPRRSKDEAGEWREATAVAAEDTTLLVLRRDAYVRVMRQVHAAVAADNAALLRRVPLIATCCGAAEVSLLGELAWRRHYPSGSIIVRQGQPLEGLYIVVKGRVGMHVAAPVSAEAPPRWRVRQQESAPAAARDLPTPRGRVPTARQRPLSASSTASRASSASSASARSGRSRRSGGPGRPTSAAAARGEAAAGGGRPPTPSPVPSTTLELVTAMLRSNAQPSAIAAAILASASARGRAAAPAANALASHEAASSESAGSAPTARLRGPPAPLPQLTPASPRAGEAPFPLASPIKDPLRQRAAPHREPQAGRLSIGSLGALEWYGEAQALTVSHGGARTAAVAEAAAPPPSHPQFTVSTPSPATLTAESHVDMLVLSRQAVYLATGFAARQLIRYAAAPRARPPAPELDATAPRRSPSPDGARRPGTAGARPPSAPAPSAAGAGVGGLQSPEQRALRWQAERRRLVDAVRLASERVQAKAAQSRGATISLRGHLFRLPSALAAGRLREVEGMPGAGGRPPAPGMRPQTAAFGTGAL